MVTRIRSRQMSVHEKIGGIANFTLRDAAHNIGIILVGIIYTNKHLPAKCL